jgi:hypothetical protein
MLDARERTWFETPVDRSAPSREALAIKLASAISVPGVDVAATSSGGGPRLYEVRAAGRGITEATEMSAQTSKIDVRADPGAVSVITLVAMSGASGPRACLGFGLGCQWRPGVCPVA